MGLKDRLQHAWSAFKDATPAPPLNYTQVIGSSYGRRPDRIRLSRTNDRTIVTSIYNRISLDASSIAIKHCRIDDNDRFIEEMDSGLNNCLSLEANIDQTHRAFLQDVVMSMFDEGCVAIVPTETNFDPRHNNAFDITRMRTASIVGWYPEHVRVRMYNERTGKRDDFVFPKRMVAIIENPYYAVVNEPNSTMQRLKRALNLMDMTDENTASGKLDLIIQLPYVIKTDSRREQADKRRKDIEQQLAGSKYGIAYTDGTEKITQLNRSVENNLQQRVEYLTQLLLSQLNITQSILDGTADEQTMLNYTNRTIEPIVAAIVDEMKRKFLTKTARTQGQTIMMFKDPFKLVPVNSIAEIADKFTRNEIISSNEIRSIIGMKPSNDPKADQLINSNLNHAPGEYGATQPPPQAGNQPPMDGKDVTEQLLKQIERT